MAYGDVDRQCACASMRTWRCVEVLHSLVENGQRIVQGALSLSKTAQAGKLEILSLSRLKCF